MITWNSSSAAAGVQGEVADLIEAEEIEPSVAAEDAGELFVVGGFGELVDQLGAGDVADPVAGSAAAVPSAISRWVLPVPGVMARDCNIFGRCCRARCG